MPVKGNVTVGKELEVVFQANLANAGETHLGIMWLRKAPGDTVPPETLEEVLPGQTVSLWKGKVPKGARRLRLDVDLPTGGSGMVRVVHKGAEWSPLTEPVTKDEIWVFGVREGTP